MIDQEQIDQQPQDQAARADQAEKVRKPVAVALKFAFLLAAVVGAAIVASLFVPHAPKASPVSQIPPRVDTSVPKGTKVKIQDVDWRLAPQTIVIVISKGCEFCEEGAPAYAEVLKKLSGRKDLNVVAALPQDVEDGKDYVSEIGLDIPMVRQVQLSAIGVKATPTLLIVDSTGGVTDSWVGTLSEKREAEVLTALGAK
jgi:hypothetical protein